jgi:hypothetical protein
LLRIPARRAVLLRERGRAVPLKLIPGEIEVAIAKRWRPAHSDSRDRTGQAPAAAQQDEILRRVRAAQVEALYGSLVLGIALTPVVAAALVLLL